MATINAHKPRRTNNYSQSGSTTYPANNQLTDYESDAAYFSDLQQPQQQHQQLMQQQDPEHQSPPPPTRTNEEINLSVLRRHNSDIVAILSLAQYAVVYLFNPTSRQWEKNGVEGTLFVCQMTQGSLGEDRYTAFVLNRRGLNNFNLQLTDAENVELTEEYVILKADENAAGEMTEAGQGNGGSAPGLRIYGIWIYSEPPPNSTAQARTVNAEKIRECAAHAGQSLKTAQERLEAIQQNGLHAAALLAENQVAPLEEVQASVAMGRQISLKDLFGQQRAQDDGWSVRAHHETQAQPLPHQQQQFQSQAAPQQRQQQYQQPVPLQQHSSQFYHNAPGYSVVPQQPQQTYHTPPPLPSAGQPGDVLGDLFRRAGFAYQAHDGQVN
ncbi:Uncharacterized protein PECH_008436 [Penicillium ucsense]|uniref:Decapping enzyme Dcp1 n=1 Tax=Penicillium ucsense TaxID=2839758 RepID=A0A8J8W9E5_9EURO|nr:Uncharacterized protein PECM_003682 [Penicillium ucsense]KAF7734123.1 Uncharacterized protein PECH_008436 [Penicillium ucsense]